MNRGLNRAQKNYVIVGLCAILLIMAVGYAAFSSQLKISGTSNIAGNFLVKITSITPTDIVGNAEDKPEVTTHTDTIATFGTTLQSPGDSITYNVVIENQGNIDAVLKTINKTDASNSAILFETLGVNEGDELLHGETVTMKVKVTYNPNVTTQPNNLESTLNMTLDYAQVGTEVVPGTNNILLGGTSVPLVDSGDGLYADEYEAGRYIYRGSNPDNYITFNDELWRIIAKETDGTYKIIKNEIAEDKMWDSTNSHDWNRPADISTYLTNEYYNNIDAFFKGKVISHEFGVGKVIYNNDNLMQQIADEKKIIWNGKVGLISVSDYIKANNNHQLCGTHYLYKKNSDFCSQINWLYINGKSWWAITPDSAYHDVVYFVQDDGNINSNWANNVYGIRPVVFLKSNIILSGDGSKENPYVII